MGLKKGQTNSGSFKKGMKVSWEGRRKYSFNCKNCDVCVRTSDKRRKYCGKSCHLLYEYNNGLRKVNVSGWNKGTKGIMKSNKTSFTKERVSGEKNVNWKGGITPLNKKLRSSSMWKIWREAVFLRDNFTCQNPKCSYCNNKMGVILHPHHIKPFALYPELRFDISNGVTYCSEFHINSKTLHKGIVRRGVLFQQVQ